MSKSLYIKTLLWMAWALVALACEKEADNPSSAQEVQTVHYRATVHTGIDTKATVGDDMKYKFEEGDRLYVESADKKLYGFLSLSTSGGAGNSMALFEGDLIYAEETPFPNDNPVINLVLVSKEDELHTITDGKVDTVTTASYLAKKWAPSLGEAVSHLSHFTGTGNFDDPKFTLNQQSGFLKCFVRMKSEQAPVDRVLTAKLLNNGQPFREASVKVSEEGAVPFVFAYLGDQVTLENAQLVVEYNNEQLAQFGITGKELAANKYYSISRSTLSFDGFKIRADKDNTMVWFNYTKDDSGIYYSTDFGETWTPYPSNKPQIKLMANEVICLKGNRENYFNDKKNNQGWWTPEDKPIFRANGLCYISGNVMSLLSNEEQLSDSAFEGAFSRGTTAIDYIDIDPDEPLILPLTKLASRCYMQMFRNCTSLTKTPTFTVEEAASQCCYNMFRQCSGLEDVSTIQLPDQTLEEDCYRELFRQCTSLTGVSPDFLPAEHLAKACYQQMFNGCTRLVNVPNLPATTLAESCYEVMFSGCNQITKAPDLPATTLVARCYYQMFINCNNLGSIKCLATTDISKNNSTFEWVKNVKSKGTFTKAKDISSWSTGVSGIPTNWDVAEYPSE